MTITFCTFNLRYDNPRDGEDCWDNRSGLVCDLWRSHRWDVVGIQEGLRHQLDHIRAEVPEYAETGSGRDDGVSAGEHCAILYRTDRFELITTGTFWFSETPEIPGSRSWGTRHARICTWAYLIEREVGRAFWVYNLHVDHESQEARERSSDLLIDHVRSRHPGSGSPFPGGERGWGRAVSGVGPVVVMGDFNANFDNPAVRRLSEPDSPFRIDTYAAAHPDHGDVYTFHKFTGANVEGKIDYIFASPEWTVDAAEILREHVDGRYPSDHFPVTATLSIS